MAIAMRTLVHSKANLLLHFRFWWHLIKIKVPKFLADTNFFFIFERPTYRQTQRHTDTHTYNAQSQRKLVRKSPIRVLNYRLITELYILLVM